MEKPLIVGLDPGTTFGVALLDIEGNLVHVVSIRHATRKKVIEEIMKFGKPLVVATDVKPAPKTVEQISRALGCALFVPKDSLTTEQKIKLTKGYEFETVHERDALAAVIVAYNNYKQLFKRILKTSKGDLKKAGDLAKKLLSGEASNIKDALIDQKLSVVSARKKRKKLSEECKRIIEGYKKLLERKEEQIKKLQQLIKSEKNVKVVKVQSRAEKLLRNEIKELKDFLELSKKLRRVYSKGLLPVLLVEDCSLAHLQKLDTLIGLDDLILLVKCEKPLNLRGFKVRGIIVEKDYYEEILDLKVPVVALDEIKLVEFDGVFGVESEKWEEVLKKTKLTKLERLVKAYRNLRGKI